MSPTSAATTAPAFVQLPSVDSRGTPSPGRHGNGENDAGDVHSTAGPPALRYSPWLSFRRRSRLAPDKCDASKRTTRYLLQSSVPAVTWWLRLAATSRWISRPCAALGWQASQSHSLPEQLARLVAAEHARLQWGHCATDEERIAHLPANIRDMLPPAGNRDLISDTL
ncbi:hypothetical protein PR003_g31020 [Phytophthora rubi]|uniref:Uncharacterized protein n=1 Tax=Phytophthora rubi TaxID=129364 RepID=A0A6A4BBQ0_9STRA|nr:hypothetical protein PR001_g21301 [Phytophthora rubi]KAE9269837.1 hypothetical protein PR003_g31020 [Phytophthora rubi]